MDYIDPIEPLFTRTLFKKTAYFNHPTCFVFYFFKITFMQINVSEYTSPNVSGNMKSKLLNFLLIVTSLLGYLEWGGDNHIFLFKAEAEILSKLFTDPLSVLHPFTLLPLAGQIILLITLFQKKPGIYFTYLSIAGLGLLFVFMFAIGLITTNFKILLSTFPFIFVAVLTIRHQRKLKQGETNKM